MKQFNDSPKSSRITDSTFALLARDHEAAERTATAPPDLTPVKSAGFLSTRADERRVLNIVRDFFFVAQLSLRRPPLTLRQRPMQGGIGMSAKGLAARAKKPCNMQAPRLIAGLYPRKIPFQFA